MLMATAVPGFNFVAIHAISGDFAQLKDKKWVRRSDLKQSYASAYSGVMFDYPLPFPIAWVIQASIPASTPGGSRNIKTPAISRYTLVYIYATVKVDQWDWYLVGPGQWLPQQKVARVVPATRPKDATDKWVSVDLFEKVLTAYEGDKLVFATLRQSTSASIWHGRRCLQWVAPRCCPDRWTNSSVRAMSQALLPEQAKPCTPLVQSRARMRLKPLTFSASQPVKMLQAP